MLCAGYALRLYVFLELFEFSSISFTKCDFEEINFSMTSNTKYLRKVRNKYVENVNFNNLLRNKDYFG